MELGVSKRNYEEGEQAQAQAQALKYRIRSLSHRASRHSSAIVDGCAGCLPWHTGTLEHWHTRTLAERANGKTQCQEP